MATKIINGVEVQLTPQEQTEMEAEWAANTSQTEVQRQEQRRGEAIRGMTASQEPTVIVSRAMLGMILDEITRLSNQGNALRAAIAGAGTYAAARTAFTAVPPLAIKTIVDMRNAVRGKIESGGGD